MAYTPQRWVIVEINSNDDPIYYKVLAGWESSRDESWRMNSGITRVEETDDAWEFYGSSGSCYSCSKERYGFTNVSENIFHQLRNHYGDQVKLLCEDTDWNKLEINI
jgi:hypothetical protein